MTGTARLPNANQVIKVMMPELFPFLSLPKNTKWNYLAISVFCPPILCPFAGRLFLSIPSLLLPRWIKLHIPRLSVDLWDLEVPNSSSEMNVHPWSTSGMQRETNDWALSNSQHPAGRKAAIWDFQSIWESHKVRLAIGSQRYQLSTSSVGPESLLPRASKQKANVPY